MKPKARRRPRPKISPTPTPERCESCGTGDLPLNAATGEWLCWNCSDRPPTRQLLFWPAAATPEVPTGLTIPESRLIDS